MKTIRAFVVLAFACMLFAAFPGSSFGKKKQVVMQPEQLKIGQTITCSSVLGGAAPWDVKPKSFKLTFRGLTAFPGFSGEYLIVAEMKDKNLPVAHGMSGSPCTVHGKLIGALSMDLLPFPKNGKGLAGITPIRAMRDPDAIVRGTPEIGDKAAFTTQLFGLDEKQVAGLNHVLGYTAFVASGSAPAPVKISNGTLPSRRLRPGESVIGMLASGDFPVYYGCTVTEVTEKDFSACGHPVVGQSLTYPAYRSKITTIGRSNDTSSKIMGEILEPAGTFTEDTPFAVKGVNAVQKDVMLPVHFAITKNGTLYDYHFSVLRHPSFSGKLINAGLTALVGNVWSPSDVGTAKLTAKIYLRGRKEPLVYNGTSVISMQREKLGFMEGFSNPWAILENVPDAVTSIEQSGWHLTVERIEVALDIQSGRQILGLDSLAVLDSQGKKTEEIHAGETITVEIGLRDTTSTVKLVRRFVIQIPKEFHFIMPPMSDQRFLPAHLAIMSGSEYQEFDPKKLPKGAPESAEAFLKMFSLNQKDPSKIYAVLILPEEYPTNRPDSGSASAPDISKGTWQAVPSLDFLREQSLVFRQRVIVIDLGTPRKGMIATVGVVKSLKFMIDGQ